MRILIDTNILFSTILFPNSRLARVVLYIIAYHEVVLCDQNIFELWEVLNRKYPSKLPDAEVFLAELSYELIPAVYHTEKLIRDAKDQPILNAAIVTGVDIILTGDTDFLSLEIEHPKCMNIAGFIEYEGLDF